MTRWNVNDPAIVGPEYFGASSRQDILVGIGPQVLQRFRSNAAETIGAVRVHGSQSGLGYPQLYLLELLVAGAELTGDDPVAVQTAAPNALAIISGNVNDGGLGPPSVSAIDEWPPNYSDVVSMGPSASFDLQFATSAFAPPGRIAAVAVELVTDWGYPPRTTATEAVRRTVVSLLNGGSLHGTQTRIIPNNNSSGTGGRLLVSWGEVNPITGRPWTVQDVQDFDTAATQVRLARQTGDGGAWSITAARLIVAYETVERRQAIGVLTVAGSAAVGWSADVALAEPDGSANWSKLSAVDYVLVVRVADRGGLQGFGSDWLNVTSLQAAPGEASPPDLLAYQIGSETRTVLTDNGVTVTVQVPTAAGMVENVGQLMPFVLRTTAPATSADGQPYVEVRTVEVFDGGGASEQELTPSANEDYAGLRLMLGMAAAAPTADLTVTVRRRSDDVAMGVFTIDDTDLAIAGATPNGGLVLVETKAPQPGFSLVGGTQYYLDFTSLAPVATPWLVGLLAVVAGGGGVLYEEATYEGGTDRADPIASVAATALSFTPADFAAVIDSAVDTPATFAATADVEAIPDPPGGCAALGIPFVELTWDATALGVAFGYYQLQRLDPVLGWLDIAIIQDEAVESFPDYEALLAVEETYRLRVVRSDGAVSYWSDEEVATTETAGCVYTFTTNQAPSMGVAYADVYDRVAERGYDFPEAEEVQIRRMFDRDFQVAFRPLSRRGVAFDRLLLVGAIAAPAAGVGPPAAEALRDLAWATVSYVCVRDSDGNRWFGSITVPALAVRQPAQLHRATLTFIETTAVPAAATTEPGAPVGGDFTFIGGDPIELVGGAGPLSLV